MGGTGTDCFGGVPSTEIDSGEGGHITWRFADVGDAIIPQCASVPPSPALDAIIIENDTGMPLSATNRFGGVPRTEIDKR